LSGHIWGNLVIMMRLDELLGGRDLAVDRGDVPVDVDALGPARCSTWRSRPSRERVCLRASSSPFHRRRWFRALEDSGQI
jgi:hypothetical protein